MAFKRIAVDTSKAVFTVHGIDEADRPVLKHDLSRARLRGDGVCFRGKQWRPSLGTLAGGSRASTTNKKKNTESFDLGMAMLGMDNDAGTSPDSEGIMHPSLAEKP